MLPAELECSLDEQARKQASDLDLLREFEDSSVPQWLNLGMTRF